MELESPAAFAKRVGINDKLIRQYVKQGKLPFIKVGKTHVKIHIEAALDAIRKMAESTAEDKKMYMPVEVPFIPYKPKEKKHRGRLPDKVRLAKKNTLGA